MAVGKGSMARASKAAAKKGDVATVVANPDEKVVEAVVEEVKEETPKVETKKATTKKTTAKKTTTKKVASKKTETKDEADVKNVIAVEVKEEAESGAKGNEFCGIGEEMPFYLF